MGIVEEELADFELSTGQRHCVELNMGGAVHLHMGNVRLDMTEAEFRHFVAVVSEARDRLREEKGGSLPGERSVDRTTPVESTAITSPETEAEIQKDAKTASGAQDDD